jgi:hypothetical protein
MSSQVKKFRPSVQITRQKTPVLFNCFIAILKDAIVCINNRKYKNDNQRDEFWGRDRQLSHKEYRTVLGYLSEIVRLSCWLTVLPPLYLQLTIFFVLIFIVVIM